MHQFDTWGFAVLDLEGEPVVVMDGSISIRPILKILRFDIMPKVRVAEIGLERAQERLDVLVRYHDEIAEYCRECGIKPPF